MKPRSPNNDTEQPKEVSGKQRQIKPCKLNLEKYEWCDITVTLLGVPISKIITHRYK